MPDNNAGEATTGKFLTRIVPMVSTGLVVGTIAIIIEISFAALIFSGPLSSFVSAGIGFTLFGYAALGLVSALTSSFPGTISIPQDSPSAISAVMAAAVAAAMPSSSPPEQIFATVIAAMVIASLLNGALFLALGRFHLGNLTRFIPYPVVGGFLAGTGWLLVTGAINVMTGSKLGLSTLAGLLAPEMAARWVPGLILAVALILVLRYTSHFLAMPGMLLGAVGLFYLVLLVIGMPVHEAEAGRWLIGPFPEGGLWKPMGLSQWQTVSWSAVFGQAGNIGTIFIISVISLLLNASGLELTVRKDIDLNRELKSAGIANIVAGLGCGGPVGYPALSLSALVARLGVPNRTVGVVAALLSASALLFGPSLIALFPRPVLGGLILFLGLSFLEEWLVKAAGKLPKTEYALILLILAVVAEFGFLQGVGIGLGVAVLMFVVNYSRIDVVRLELSGAEFHSHVDRPLPFQWILDKKGDRIYVLKLQGFIFFGTADKLLRQVVQRAQDTSREHLRFLVFDFGRVTGLDSSAMNSFSRMRHLSEAEDFVMVFTHLQGQHLLEIGGILKDQDPRLQIFPDLDTGLEWCEERILAEEKKVLTDPLESEVRPKRDEIFDSTVDGMLEYLEFQEQFESLIERMEPYLERMEATPGTRLIRQGEANPGVFLVASGQVTEGMEGDDGRLTRVRTMGMGTVGGEIYSDGKTGAAYSMAAVRPSIVYRLAPDRLRAMEAEDPETASLFHRYAARLAEQRLSVMRRLLNALLQEGRS